MSDDLKKEFKENPSRMDRFSQAVNNLTGVRCIKGLKVLWKVSRPLISAPLVSQKPQNFKRKLKHLLWPE